MRSVRPSKGRYAQNEKKEYNKENNNIEKGGDTSYRRAPPPATDVNDLYQEKASATREAYTRLRLRHMARPTFFRMRNAPKATLYRVDEWSAHSKGQDSTSYMRPLLRMQAHCHLHWTDSKEQRTDRPLSYSQRQRERIATSKRLQYFTTQNIVQYTQNAYIKKDFSSLFINVI